MNRVVHFEMHVVDPGASIPFFEKVFGWKIAKWGGGSEEYFLVTTGEDGTPGINGGMMKSRDGEPRTVNTVQVSSVDEFAKKVTENGGEVVVPRMGIPGMGYVIYCKDPGGVLFGCFEANPSA